MSRAIAKMDLSFLDPPKRTLNKQQIKDQIQLCLAQFRSLSDDISRYVYLENIHNRSETIYFGMILSNVEEMFPVVYTPTVGLACIHVPWVFKDSRGLFLRVSQRNDFRRILALCRDEVEIIVVSDGSRILGLGDLGANGMGIPLGKLSLYVACAGIDPQKTLPVILDFGTSNQKLLADHLYYGEHRTRTTNDDEYNDIVRDFVLAVKSRWSNALIQWEDISNDHCFRVLREWRSNVLSFNDDIQGTGAVVLAAVMSNLRLRNSDEKLYDQRFVVYGAGSAAVGIADMIIVGMVEDAKKHKVILSIEECRKHFWFVDSQGLVTKKRPGNIQEHKSAYSRTDEEPMHKLVDIINMAKPTILLGLSKHAKAFNKEVIEAICMSCQQPLIMALSNPTEKSECTAQECYDFSAGKALYASGSPMPPVKCEDKSNNIHSSQVNNLYIFPGVGLGATVGKLVHIPDSVFYVAAKCLASLTTKEDFLVGKILPSLERVREISLKIATAIVNYALKQDLSTLSPDDIRYDGQYNQTVPISSEPASEIEITKYISARMWSPFEVESEVV